MLWVQYDASSWPSISSVYWENRTLSAAPGIEVQKGKEKEKITRASEEVIKSRRSELPLPVGPVLVQQPARGRGIGGPELRRARAAAVTCSKGWSSSDLQLLAKRLFPRQLNLFLQPPITTQLHSHQKSFLDIWQDVQEVSIYSFPQSTAAPAAN